MVFPHDLLYFSQNTNKIHTKYIQNTRKMYIIHKNAHNSQFWNPIKTKMSQSFK